MTGRDLIIYILKNNLEDEEVFKDGKLLGYLNVDEAALKFGVGPATIKVWYTLGVLKGIEIGGEIYIPANAVVVIVTGDEEK